MYEVQVSQSFSSSVMLVAVGLSYVFYEVEICSL